MPEVSLARHGIEQRAMTGMFAVVVMGGAVLIGATIGSLIGAVLDRLRPTGRHRKRMPSSGLVLMLPFAMYVALCLSGEQR